MVEFEITEKIASEIVSLAYFEMFLYFILGVALIAALVGVLTPTKSRRYRKWIVDMHVASKIRDLARMDGLDLEEEARLFGEWSEKNKDNPRRKELDEVVEDKLMERVETNTICESSKGYLDLTKKKEEKK